MTGRISFCLLLFLTGCCDCTLRGTISLVHGDATRYCRICADHTMCQFRFDDDVGKKCTDLEIADPSEQDIEAIIGWHNMYRNTLASGAEERGNPGPQRPAKYMMEMIWDVELAHIARRWALQCSLSKRDQCRDVERFRVWQNVHVLDMDSVGNITSTARIHFHIQSWYDEVEHFDSAEFGFVNFSTRTNQPYIAFAAATITHVGCGRAIYRIGENISKQAEHRRKLIGTMPARFGNLVGKRVETLVCNYGPLDRKAARELYEDGAPGLCPRGTIRSSRYGALCQKFQELSSHQRKIRPWFEEEEESEVKESKGGALSIASAVCLVQLLLFACMSI